MGRDGELPALSAPAGRVSERQDESARDRGGTVESSGPRRGNRAVAHVDAIARLEPAGVMLSTGLFVRRTFAVDEESKTERSYLQGGLGLALTPASFEPRAHVEYRPFTSFALRMEGGPVRYFGENYGLLSFDSADADFGDDALSERRGDERAAWGLRGAFSLLPRAKLGPVLCQTRLAITGYRFDDTGPYVYEPEHDLLLATSDVVLSSRTDFLFTAYEGAGAETLLAGPMMESLRAWETELSRTRLGGSVFFVPADSFASFRRPRLFASAGVNVSDPNRKGEPFANLGVGADME